MILKNNLNNISLKYLDRIESKLIQSTSCEVDWLK